MTMFPVRHTLYWRLSAWYSFIFRGLVYKKLADLPTELMVTAALFAAKTTRPCFSSLETRYYAAFFICTCRRAATQ